VSTPAATTSGSAPQQREALIYVGGLDLGLTSGKTIAGVVNRLQAAADREAQTGAATFQVQFHEDSLKDPGPGPRLRRVATLSRTDGSQEVPVFDLFEYSWSSTLTDQWAKQGRVQRAARGFFAALRIPRFIRFFRSGGKKTPYGRLQLAMSGFVSILALAYVALLLVAGVQSITQLSAITTGDDEKPAATSTANKQSAEPASDQTAEEDRPETTWAQLLAIIGTTILPFIGKGKDRLARIGAALFAANAYVHIGDNRERIVEGLVAGAERIREDQMYGSASVVAYSFGGVVALDALLPRTGPPERSFEKVTRIVTIGMPYEFVQAVDRDYWDRRHGPEEPLEWTNIYSVIDLLGSNLRNDSGDGEAQLGINTGPSPAGPAAIRPDNNLPFDTGIDLTFLTIVELYGFISHGMYWGRDDSRDRNVFRQVIGVLYQGAPALG
jgi:hypothetical protein